MSNEPRLTAEASLYRTSSSYRTTLKGSPSINAIRPAEIIEVHGCAPGTEIVEWDDGTWSCEPAGPQPWGGGSGAGRPDPYDDGAAARPPRGGGKRRPKKPIEKDRPRVLGRDCKPKDIPGGDVMTAIAECGAKARPGELRNLRCFDRPEGTKVVCCYEDAETHYMSCISDVEEVKK